MVNRFEVLDGWRGISILFVLAGHLLPLGLKDWKMNVTIATTGMVLFFILSGFLITNLLIRDQNLFNFLIRRFLRIVPLAWLVLLVTLILNDGSLHQWTSSLLFYMNWPPMNFVAGTSHFWSLSLEMQFYMSIVVLVFLLKEKSFWLLPVICICVTLNRVYHGIDVAITTYFRIDEILAGCILALVYHKGSSSLKSAIGNLNPVLLLILLICSAHPKLEWLNYFRPYIASLLIGATLFSNTEKWHDVWLKSRFLFFIAGISYALYVIHGVLRVTWLAEGDTLEKYLKRPLFFLVTFVLAYISTNYYEKYWINLGKKLVKSRSTAKSGRIY